MREARALDVPTPTTRVDPGFLVPEPAEDEDEASYLTAAALADFRHCPLLYYRKWRQNLVPPAAPGPAEILDGAVRVLVLEGRDAFDTQYVVGATVAWAADREWPWRHVITSADFALVDAMAQSAEAHPVVRQLLARGVTGGIVRADYFGRKCLARLDFFNPERGIVALKTCAALAGFPREAWMRGYVHEVAFAASLVLKAVQHAPAVYLVAVETSEPHRTGVWWLHARALVKAKRENARAMLRLVECERRNAWPTGYEDLRMLTT